MPHQLPRRSKSLRDLQTKETIRALERRPSKLGLPQQAGTAKYQLWPTASKSPVGLTRPMLLSDRSSALAVGRSPTSLSDTAVSPENLPFWHRGGSLSRRRKVSVPELGSTMTTVQETAIDSRKCTRLDCKGMQTNQGQQQFQEDLHFVRLPQNLATRDQAVFQG